MPTLVFATRNPHKVREFRDLIAPLGLDALALSEVAPHAAEVEETGQTFLANAILKAEAAWRLTGLPAVADDSGICVDHLGGAPGIRSARWAGDDEANNDRLLAELSGVPDDRRQAHYGCALALVCGPDFVALRPPAERLGDDAVLLRSEGRLDGRIGHERVGTGGFGYDPLFVLPERACTLAQLADADKHAISHRGRAFRALVAALDPLLTPSRRNP